MCLTNSGLSLTTVCPAAQSVLVAIRIHAHCTHYSTDAVRCTNSFGRCVQSERQSVGYRARTQKDRQELLSAEDGLGLEELVRSNQDNKLYGVPFCPYCTMNSNSLPNDICLCEEKLKLTTGKFPLSIFCYSVS